MGCATKNVAVTPEPGTAYVKISNINPILYDFYVKIENESGFIYERTLKNEETMELILETGIYEFCLECKKKNAFWWPEWCGTETLQPNQKLELNTWNTYDDYAYNRSSGGGDGVRMTIDILGIFFR